MGYGKERSAGGEGPSLTPILSAACAHRLPKTASSEQGARPAWRGQSLVRPRWPATQERLANSFGKSLHKAMAAGGCETARTPTIRGATCHVTTRHLSGRLLAQAAGAPSGLVQMDACTVEWEVELPYLFHLAELPLLSFALRWECGRLSFNRGRFPRPIPRLNVTPRSWEGLLEGEGRCTISVQANKSAGQAKTGRSAQRSLDSGLAVWCVIRKR
jgi:hypothetical protein